MRALLEQIKQRRLQLGLKQQDMLLKMGMSRQQYQRLESKGNPRLDTLALVAEGLESELILVPKDKIEAVRSLLQNAKNESQDEDDEYFENPWVGLIEDEDVE